MTDTSLENAILKAEKLRKDIEKTDKLLEELKDGKGFLKSDLKKEIEALTGFQYPYRDVTKEYYLKEIFKRIDEIKNKPAEKKKFGAALEESTFYQTLQKTENDLKKYGDNLDQQLKTIQRLTPKPAEAIQKPEPKPKSEPKQKPEQLPPRDLHSRGINLGGEPLPSTTIEEVDDDDTQDSQFGPEKKKPNPEDEVVDSDDDVDQPSTQGDGSRNSKKSLKSSPPLDEHKINELMADIPGYLGTITKDEIPKLTKAAKKAWLAGMPFGWIHLTISRAQAVGNNERPGEVGHWVAVAVVPGRGAVMYYDSFGRPAPADVKTTLKVMFDKVAPREFLKFKENLIQEQSVNTNNCGWFSIKFLLDIFGGMEFTDTTPWNRSVQAERDIEKFKKKFKPFSWL